MTERRDRSSAASMSDCLSRTRAVPFTTTLHASSASKPSVSSATFLFTVSSASFVPGDVRKRRRLVGSDKIHRVDVGLVRDAHGQAAQARGTQRLPAFDFAEELDACCGISVHGGLPPGLGWMGVQ